MRIYHRKEQILTELLQSDDFITSNFLSERIGVSRRTIREDIKELTIALSDRNVILLSIPGKGYLIAKDEKLAAAAYLADLKKVRQQNPVSPMERKQFILHQLLFSSSVVDPYVLEEELFVSVPTVEKDLQEVAVWLGRNNLNLRKDPNGSFYIEGREITFRYGMINFIHQFLQNQASFDLQEIESIVGIEFTTEIEDLLHKLHNSDFLHISDAAYSTILLYLAISASRLSQGHQLHINPKEIPTIAAQNEFTIALNFLKELENTTGFLFPESEVMQFSKVLMQANIININQTNVQAIADERTLEFVNKMIFKIQNLFALDLTDDRKFINSLVLYIRSKLLKEDQRVIQSALKISEIEKEYPQALEITMLISNDLKKKLDSRLSEAEISELALFVCAAMERKQVSGKSSILKVAIVCAAGKGGSQLLSVKIEKSFKDIEILGVFPSHRLPEIQTLHPDLILSTIPLDLEGTAYLQVSPLLTGEDQERVQEMVNELRGPSQNAGKRALLELLDEKLFFPTMQSSSAETAIRWMGTQLLALDYVEGSFIQSVLDREALYATSLGNLAAIPHAFLQHTNKPCIAIGILEKPIQWGDDQVQIVFLLNISTSQEEDFKPIFEHLYQLLSNKKNVQRLIKTTDFAEFIKELNG